MTDTRDICERIEERLDEGKRFGEAVLVNEGTLADAKAEIEAQRHDIDRLQDTTTELATENVRLRDFADRYNADMALASATVDGLKAKIAELEAQRNAAWRALDAAKALRAAQVAYMANRGNEEFGKRVGEAAAALDAEIVAVEQASKEGGR